MSLHRKTGFQNLLAQACSALAASFGLIALLGWIMELPLLSGFGLHLIPMAPSTALLFILMGVLSFFQARGAKNRTVNRTELLIGCLVAFISLALLFLSSQGIYTDVEHLGLQIDGKLNNTPIGHMSPVTAFSFLLVSLTFLILHSTPSASHRQVLAAWGLAGFIILTNYVFVLAYFLGLPLLYGINTIPPALPTSLAFLSLGIALLANASTQKKTQETGVSTPVPYTILLVFTILVLSIVTGGYLYNQNYEQQFRNQIEHQLSAIADLKVSGLVSWRNERLADANVLYRNPAFAELVTYYLENPADLQAQKQLQAWLDKFQTNYKYERVSLLDTHGLERISAPAPPAPTNVYLVEHAAIALRSGQVTFVDFHRDTPDDPIHLALLVPIFSEQEGGYPLGVLFFQIDPEIYLYPFLQQWPIPSLSAETLLIRREEDAALFLNPLRFQPDAALNLRIPLTDTDRLAVKAALGQTGIIEGRNYSGDAVFGALAPVPDTPWFLVAHMDMAEIYAALRERLWETSLFFGGLLAASGAGLLLFWRQQRMRYYQAQIETLNALHESQAQVANVFRSAMDAIITVDEDQKIIIFNPSAEQMFGCPADEVIGQTMDRFLPEYAHKLHRERMHFFGQSDSTKHSMKAPMLALTCLRANGEAFASDISISHIEIGGRKLYTAIIRDSTERKKAEDALQKSQAQLQAIMDYSPALISIKDLDGNIILANQSFSVLDAPPLNELIGKNVFEIFPKEVAEQLWRNDLAALQTKAPVRSEEIVKHKDGTWHTYLTVKFPIYLQSDQPFGICAISNDITDRKQAEDKLRETNDYLENLFNYANAPIIVWDTQFKITRFNHAFETMTGRSAAEVLGQSLEILFPPAQNQASMELIQKTLTGERWEVVEISIQNLDGSIRTVLWNSATLFSVDGKTPIATIAQGQDVTERKKAENMLEARLRLVEFAAKHSLDEVLTKTLDEVCLITDSPIGFYHFVESDQKTISLQAWSTRTMQEYCKADGKGLHYDVDQAGVWVDCIHQRQPVIHNDYASLPASHRKGLPAGHAELVRELVVPILRNGLIVAILGIGNKTQDYTEKDVDTVAYFADVAWEIASRKRAEDSLQNYNIHLEKEVGQRTRELRDTQEQLVRQERLTALGQLAGSLGHELRNPLGVISNAVYFLKISQPEASTKVREYLDILEKETLVSNKIVTDLLDFTRIKSLDRQPVSVTEIIDQTLERNPVPAPVDVQVEIPANLRQIFADPLHVTQILGNLISNAHQAMLAAKPASIEKNLKVSVTEQHDMIKITVTDTGPGIPPENLVKLFQPLFTTKTKGIGLGLAVSQKLVEANGGKIEVESAVGKGSKFSVYLPVYSVTASGSEAVSA